MNLTFLIKYNLRTGSTTATPPTTTPPSPQKKTNHSIHNFFWALLPFPQNSRNQNSRSPAILPRGRGGREKLSPIHSPRSKIFPKSPHKSTPSTRSPCKCNPYQKMKKYEKFKKQTPSPWSPPLRNAHERRKNASRCR